MTFANHLAPGSAFDGESIPLEYFQDELAARLSPDQQVQFRSFNTLARYYRKKAKTSTTPERWIERAERAEKAANQMQRDF